MWLMEDCEVQNSAMGIELMTSRRCVATHDHQTGLKFSFILWFKISCIFVQASSLSIQSWRLRTKSSFSSAFGSASVWLSSFSTGSTYMFVTLNMNAIGTILLRYHSIDPYIKALSPILIYLTQSPLIRYNFISTLQ